MRLGSGQTVKAGKQNASLAVRPFYLDGGADRGQRDAHIRRMYGNAVVTCTQDGVDGVDPADGRATGARLTLVAGRRRIVEIIAPRSLEQITASRGGIS